MDEYFDDLCADTDDNDSFNTFIWDRHNFIALNDLCGLTHCFTKASSESMIIMHDLGIVTQTQDDH